MRVQMEGLRVEFPEYFAQIKGAVERCFQRLNRTDGNLSAIIRFEIERSGRIRSAAIIPHRRSGNRVFDATAIGSVECAGQGSIGPLPQGMPVDILPVELTFRPL
jgi:hypothetical protein